jgi:hypothetical protein
MIEDETGRLTSLPPPPGIRDFKLEMLAQWLLRDEPVPEPLQTPALNHAYSAATTNLARWDSHITATALALEAAFFPTLRSVGTFETAESIRRGLLSWESAGRQYTFYSESIDAALSSLIVGAWTTAETFLGDVWQTAVNVHPEVLAELRGARNRIRRLSNGEPSPSGAADNQRDKTVELSFLQRHGYNLRDVMGNVLARRFDFSRVSDIREAFSQSFSCDSSSIDEALSDQSLDALSLVRNVIVHNAGIADEPYASRCDSYPLAPTLSKGQRLNLNGEIVARLLLTGRECAVKLIRGVDRWLVQH